MPFGEDIKSPFNLLMLALAIVGVSAGFYFYFFPHNERGIAYIVGVSKFQAGIKQRKWGEFAFALFQLCNVIYLLRFVLWDDLRSKKKLAIAFGAILVISIGVLVWSMTSLTLFSPTPPL